MDITLQKSHIILRAKEEIYIAVRSHLKELPANANGEFGMQALDDYMHERKMLDMLGQALSEFKLALDKYAGADDLRHDSDNFSIAFNVSHSVEATRGTDIKRLCMAYIVRRIVADWWLANYPEYVTPYTTECQAILAELTDILAMRRPVCNLHHMAYINPDGTFMVVLYKDEILCDIEEETLKLAKFRKGVTANHQELALDINYDGQRLTRLADKYLQRCRSMLQAYLVEGQWPMQNGQWSMVNGQWTAVNGQSSMTDNSNFQGWDYKYILRFPPDWRAVMMQQLADELHSFTVNSVLADFFKVSFPKDAEMYDVAASDSSLEIKHIITSRMHSPMRRPHGLPHFIWMPELPKVEPIPDEDIYRLSDH